VKKLVVIGAGPSGLAAALGAVKRGFDVTVLERDDVGASLRRWGATRLFSPLAMNVPAGAAELVALPPGDAIMTGNEFVDAVLAPLATSAPLAGRVLARHAVLAVGRDRLCRGDYANHPLRAERGFRLVVDTPHGERTFEADAVLDASGTLLPCAIGAGGIVAPGERAARERIVCSLGELDARLANLRVLIVGHGHSAANALHVLGNIDARVVWAVRTPNLRPCVEVASDPLPERQRVVATANELAAKPPAWLRVERRAHVLAIEPGNNGLRVSLTGDRVVEVDRVVGLTGARPDLSFVTELALDISPATEGAGGLARGLANVTDCLAVPALGASDLASGEPGFHLVGAKSYGRARTFLLKTGYAQIDTILDGLDR